MNWIVLALIASAQDSHVVTDGTEMRALFSQDAFASERDMKEWMSGKGEKEFYFGPVSRDQDVFIELIRDEVTEWDVTSKYSVFVTEQQIVVIWHLKPDARCYCEPEAYLTSEEKLRLAEPKKAIKTDL